MNEGIKKIFTTRDFVVINFTLNDRLHDYDIPKSMLKNHEDVVFWIAHLSEKVWMTKQDIVNFSSFCRQYFDSTNIKE